jgi:multiple sugar transport system substrate-binding protein
MAEGRTLRRRELLVAGAVGMAAPAACGRSGPGVAEVTAGGGGPYRGRPGELSYWTGFTGDDGPTMQALVDRFNREEPRIDVAMNVILWNDFYQKVPAAVYSGNGPCTTPGTASTPRAGCGSTGSCGAPADRSGRD